MHGAVRFIAWFAVAAVLVAWQVTATLQLFAGALTGLVVAMTLVTLVFGIVRGLSSGRWRLARRAALMVLVVSASLALANVIANWQQEASIAAATPLLDALEKHRSANGRLPASLDDLADHFPEGLPKSRMGWGGGPFRFLRHRDTDDFTLSFGLPNGYVCSYDSRQAIWSTHD